MSQNFLHLCGWLHDPKKVEAVQATLKHPVFGASCGLIRDSGKGKTVLLYQFIEKLNGKFNVRKQEGPDCVSFGAAAAVDGVKAAEIVSQGQFEEWVAETSTEDIYGGSRINIGQGQLGNEGGSLGAWAAKYVRDYGTLIRQNYGSIDLTHYSWNRANNWGNPGVGVPHELLEKAKEHKIRTVSQINTYEECRDALANGYAVTIASNQGFSAVRDSEGFASPEGSWGHQMVLLGVDDVGIGCSHNRPGCLIQNSWGNWNSGPVRMGQPNGSFWCDAEALEERILSMGDSWAFSDYSGFVPKELNLRIV